MSLVSVDAFLITEDGTRLLGSGIFPNESRRERGLWRSVDGVVFEKVGPDRTILCLAEGRGALWACGSELDEGYSIGRSIDGGQTFEPLMQISELAGPLACPAGSDAATRCTYGDQHIALDIQGGDAGVSGPVEPPAASTGCACWSAQGPHAKSAPLIGSALLWIAWLWCQLMGKLRRHPR